MKPETRDYLQEPVAFAAWLNALSGWDGDMRELA